MGQRLLRFLVRLILPLIARVEIHGYDHIPDTGFVLAPNHLGRLDSALVFYAIDRDDLIMPVAEKYRNHPLFDFLVKMMGGFYINRFEADIGAMREVLSRLKKGGFLAMAPEGTRSKTEALQEGHPGAAYLASKTGVPIVPIAITGTEDRAVKDNLRHFRRTQIIVHAGDPILLEPVDGRDRDEVLKQYTEEIMCQIAALLPERYRGVYADHPRLKELIAAK
jgi:1-acyl-sn-glycerol-3-phosphate acyltransferase